MQKPVEEDNTLGSAGFQFGYHIADRGVERTQFQGDGQIDHVLNGFKHFIQVALNIGTVASHVGLDGVRVQFQSINSCIRNLLSVVYPLATRYGIDAADERHLDRLACLLDPHQVLPGTSMFQHGQVGKGLGIGLGAS